MAIVKIKNKNSVRYQVKVRDKNGSWYPSERFETMKLIGFSGHPEQRPGKRSLGVSDGCKDSEEAYKRI